jgi:signal transduction histidine kinase/pSer/pThr/pTyr-binding forkhead associated (FHA) protein
MWILTIRSAVSVPREFTLKPGITTLGRKAENDICLADDSASRVHAEITYDADANVVTIRDLGSTNGTFVDQERIAQPRQLHALDVVRIGQHVINLDERDTRAPTTPLAEGAQTGQPLTRDLLYESLDRYAVLLCKVGERLNVVTELDSALGEVADLMQEAMGADKSKVILAADFSKLQELGFPTSIAQKAISQRAAVIIPDVQSYSGDPAIGKSSLLLRVRTVLCVPVLMGEEVGGLIYAYKTDPAGRPFDQRDLQLAVGISHQAALTIQRARIMQTLEQRVAARTQELATLYNVTSVASEWLDLNVILEEALTLTLKAVGSTKGAIYLLDEAQKSLRLAVHQGLTHEQAAQIETLPASSDLTGHLTDGDQPRISLDLAADPRPFPAVLARGFRSYTGAALRARGKRVGTLCVFDTGEQHFGAEAIALLSTIADQIGVVVENARLRKHAEQAAVTQERGRLARELHDSVTQSLYTLSLFAGAGRHLAATGDMVQVQKHLDQIGTLTQQALKEMRLLVHQLRFPLLNQEGLLLALRQRLDLVERRAGVEATLQVDKFTELPVSVEEGLYWIALESLNNALKHAQAKAVTVHLACEETGVKMEVVDNGQGFDALKTSNPAGLGLVSMRERAEELGGKLDIFSKPGEGTRVCLEIPLEPSPSNRADLQPTRAK